MSHEAAEARLPDIVLERYRLNELPPAQYSRLSDRLRDDEALRRRLASLDQSDVEIRRDYQPEIFTRRVQDRSALRPARSLFPIWAASSVVMIAALILVIVPRIGSNDGEQIKGLSPELAVYRKIDGGSETLADGAVARRGDVIRLGYRAAGKAYGVILSIDGRGVVTLHLPPNGEQAAALQNEATVLLDQAYELDDAPRWERFYFVTGETSFLVEPIMDAARRAASNPRPPLSLELPRGLGQSMFLLQKEESR